MRKRVALALVIGVSVLCACSGRRVVSAPSDTLPVVIPINSQPTLANFEGHVSDTIINSFYREYKSSGDATNYIAELRRRISSGTATPAEYYWLSDALIAESANAADDTSRIRLSKESEHALYEGHRVFPNNPTLTIYGAPYDDTGVAEIAALKGKQSIYPDAYIDSAVIGQKQIVAEFQAIDRDSAARRARITQVDALEQRITALHQQIMQLDHEDPRRDKLDKEMKELMRQSEQLMQIP